MFFWVLKRLFEVVTRLGIPKFLREKKYKGKVLNVPRDCKIPEGHFDYALTCVLLIKAQFSFTLPL